MNIKSEKIKRYFKKSAVIFAWIIGSILILFLIFVIALQIPTVQNFAKNKAIFYLQNKIKTKVKLEKIEIGLPKKIILQGVYFEDQSKDTLLAGKKLAVNISLFKLFDNTLEINSVDLEGIVLNLKRNKKAIYNFDYIIKAFSNPKKTDDNAVPMQILIDKINFNNIKLKYNDEVLNSDINLFLKHLDTRIKTFDLANMNFEIPKIKIDGLHLFYKQGLSIDNKNTKENTITKDRTNLNFGFGEINLSKIIIAFEDKQSKVKSNINLQKMLLSFNKFDLRHQIIDVNKVKLNGLTGNLVLGKTIKNNNINAVAPTPPNDWKLSFNKSQISNLNFKFDDENVLSIQKGIDYKHLDIKNLNLLAVNFDYTTNYIKGKINRFSADEKSGVSIQKLKSDFYYDSKGAFLKNLYFQTPQSTIQNQIIVGYPNLNTIKNNWGQININANLKKSKVGFKDILIFVPNLQNINPFKNNPNAILVLDANLKGSIENLLISNFEVSGIGTTKLSISGNIIGLPDLKNTFYDLKIKNLESGKRDILSIVAQNIIPSNIEIPQKFIINGSFRGKINNFKTDLNLLSSFGNAKIIANFSNITQNKEKYQVKTILHHFDLGKLIKNKSLGKLSLVASANGVSLDPKRAKAIFNGAISDAEYNQYDYKNIAFVGKISNGLVNLNLDAKDKNLTFDLVGNANLKGKDPSGTLKLNIEIADLNKLNFYDSPLRLKGNLEADIQSAAIDFLNGTISANHFVVANDKE